MPHFVVLADDFTGATDAGIQLAENGISVRVMTGAIGRHLQECNCQAAVLDLETRHMSAKDAYGAVLSAARLAQSAGASILYKKTDSTLRGNIGSELKAALDAWREPRLLFSPGYPAIGRIVRDMVCYVNGVPVHKSAFGQDQLNPVVDSRIEKIIAQQAPLTVGKVESLPQVVVPDTVTEEDLDKAVKMGLSMGIRIFAGSSGMLPYLARCAMTADSNHKEYPLPGAPLIILGSSLHPASLEQIARAKEAGAGVFSLNLEQKLSECPQMLPETAEMLREMRACISQKNMVILSSVTSREMLEKHNSLLADRKISPESTAKRISALLAWMACQLMGYVPNAVLAVFGGDTAAQVMREFRVEVTKPVCQLGEGIPYCTFTSHQTQYGLITKAGGFGPPDVIMKMRAFIDGAN